MLRNLKNKSFSILLFVICLFSFSVIANSSVKEEDSVRLKKGFFALQNELGLWALKSTKYGIITEYIFDKISNPAFPSNFFLTEIAGAMGMIDTSGSIVYENVYKKILKDELLFFSKCELRDEKMKLLFSVYGDSLDNISKSKWIIWRKGTAYLSNSYEESAYPSFIKDSRLKSIGKVDDFQIINNIFVVTKSNKKQLLNNNCSLLHPETFDSVKQFRSFIVTTKYKNGYPLSYIFDKNGKKLYDGTVIHEVKEELEHHWIVIFEGKYYLMDKRNGEFGKRGYLSLSSVDKKNIFFKLLNQTGLIDLKENFLFFGRFKHIAKVGTNVLLCHSEKMNGLFHNTTKEIFYKTRNPLVYKDGFILERFPNGNIQIFNQYGSKLFPYLVKRVRIYKQNKLRTYLTCKFKGYSILLDELGRLIVSHELRYTDILDNPSLFFIFTQDNQKGLIDTNGTMVVTNRYDNIGKVSEGKIGYKLLNKWGFIDKMETLITQPKFKKILPYKNNFTAVNKGDRWGLLNEKGQWMLNPKYDKIYWNNVGGWVVKNHQYEGFIDDEGKEIITPLFAKECEQLNQQFLKIKKDNTYFLYNLEKRTYELGQWDTIEPVKYDDTWLFVKNSMHLINHH